MELLQLRYFFESAKNESFAKTAENFMVPSSSVSASVKRLEAELGCTLFDRKANRILLNNNGRRFQKAVCGIFDELEQITSQLREDISDDKEIRILIRSVRRRIIREIVAFNKKYPLVKFDTSFDFNDTDYDVYDIIIDEKNPKYCDYENFELCSLRVGISAAADNPLCNKSLRLSELRNENFICIDESSNLYQMLLKACNKAGFSPNVILKTNDSLCYASCIEGGMGLAASRYDSNQSSNHSKTKVLNILDFNERQTIYVYYRKNIDRKNVANFVSFLKSKI